MSGHGVSAHGAKQTFESRQRSMSNVILVTGPDLDPGAAELVVARGFQTVHTPPYADSQVIAQHLKSTQAVGIVSRMGRIDADVMDAAPQLRVISKHGAGVDNIDLAAAAQRGIPVLAATGANAVSVAEHTIALLLTAVKRILPLDAGLRAGRWEKPGFRGQEVAGATLALLGMGAIAQATAKIAHGLGLEIVAFDPFASDAVFVASGVKRCKTLEDLFVSADFLSLHCPLSPATRSIVNRDSLALMPAGSFVINTARGGLIDEQALLDSIRSGHVAGAGLDTFATEPPAADHPFWGEPRIIVTPHIAGVTRQANARVGREAVSGIFQVLDDVPVPAHRVVNRKLLMQAGLFATKVEE